MSFLSFLIPPAQDPWRVDSSKETGDMEWLAYKTKCPSAGVRENSTAELEQLGHGVGTQKVYQSQRPEQPSAMGEAGAGAELLQLPSLVARGLGRIEGLWSLGNALLVLELELLAALFTGDSRYVTGAIDTLGETVKRGIKAIRSPRGVTPPLDMDLTEGQKNAVLALNYYLYGRIVRFVCRQEKTLLKNFGSLSLTEKQNYIASMKELTKAGELTINAQGDTFKPSIGKRIAIERNKGPLEEFINKCENMLALEEGQSARSAA